MNIDIYIDMDIDMDIGKARKIPFFCRHLWRVASNFSQKKEFWAFPL
jgi:hypothetical protein